MACTSMSAVAFGGRVQRPRHSAAVCRRSRLSSGRRRTTCAAWSGEQASAAGRACLRLGMHPGNRAQSAALIKKKGGGQGPPRNKGRTRGQYIGDREACESRKTARAALPKQGRLPPRRWPLQSGAPPGRAAAGSARACQWLRWPAAPPPAAAAPPPCGPLLLQLANFGHTVLPIRWHSRCHGCCRRRVPTAAAPQPCGCRELLCAAAACRSCWWPQQPLVLRPTAGAASNSSRTTASKALSAAWCSGSLPSPFACHQRGRWRCRQELLRHCCVAAM